MFEFPCLYKMELQPISCAKLHSNKSEIDKESKAVTVTPTDSLFLSSAPTDGDCKCPPSPQGQGQGIINHLAFYLSLMETRLSGKWYKLYSTESDGCSFLNLQRNMMEYTGPTIALILPTEASMHNDSLSSSLKKTPGLFGFYTTNPWKESNRYYGSSDCCLFRVEPTVHVYRPLSLTQDWHILPSSGKKTVKENNFMYFYPSAGHVNATATATDYGGDMNSGIYASLNKTMTSNRGGTKPRGLVLGGSEQDPRIHITESFERCIASSGGPRDDTFESGPLLPGQWDKFFNVSSIEIWGVGGDDVVKEALSKKERQEEVHDAARRRVRRVDKSQFLEDFQSGLHIRESRGSTSLFQHRLDGTVRYDFDGEKHVID